jgi:tripartite-type tricarboxylate transporter receptor subunit TctC
LICIVRLFVLAFLIACSSWVHAQGGAGYPVKPVRLVVPFAPGGSADIMARIIGQELAKGLGQNVVVDNRPGASAIVGTDHVAKSPPDGYTLLMGNVSSMTIHPFVYPRLPYDPAKEFAPVTLLATVTTVLVAHPSLPVRTVKDVVALAKSRPGQLNFTSSGAGSSPHLAGEFLKQRAGIEMQHISYKGSGPALIDVMGGKVELMLDNLPSALPHIQSGKLRAIAVTSVQRSPALPDTPTFIESGFPGFEVVSWQAIMVPAATPKDIIARLHTELVKALNTPQVKTKLGELGAEVVGNSPEQFAAYIRQETLKWSRIVKEAGIKLEP